MNDVLIEHDTKRWIVNPLLKDMPRLFKDRVQKRLNLYILDQNSFDYSIHIPKFNVVQIFLTLEFRRLN